MEGAAPAEAGRRVKAESCLDATVQQNSGNRGGHVPTQRVAEADVEITLRITLDRPGEATRSVTSDRGGLAHAQRELGRLLGRGRQDCTEKRQLRKEQPRATSWEHWSTTTAIRPCPQDEGPVPPGRGRG